MMADLDVPEELPDHLNPCPCCGETPTGGSVRWNGFAWEHKSRETHPQAGHHVMVDPDTTPPLGPILQWCDDQGIDPDAAPKIQEAIREHATEGDA